MAQSYSFPLACWVGLSVSGTEVAQPSYKRQAATFVDEGADTVFANAATIQWPLCSTDWGPIDEVTLYDAATGGHLIGLGNVAAVTVQARMYDRLYIPPAGYQVMRAVRPLGFGTLTFGVGRYNTWNYLTAPGNGLGSPYGLFAYGTGPYEAMEQGVLLLKVFQPVQLCGGVAGDWTPVALCGVT
jgi:hypothetical protein